MVGVLGSVIGVLLAFTIATFFANHGGIRFYVTALDEVIAIIPHMDWTLVGITFLMALLVSTVASWLPALASAKLDPVEALMEV